MKIKIGYGVEADIEEVKDCLSNASFLQRYGYKAILPKGVNINDEFNNKIATKIRKEHNQNIKSYEEKKQELIKFWARKGEKLSEYFDKFPYPAPKKIIVILTAYGTGGNTYLPDTVWLRLDLSEYDIKIEENLVHEIIHLCVEKPVIQKYKLNQMEKESFVDYFFNLPGLKEVFPNYAQAKYGNPSKKLLERIEWNK